MEEPKEKQSQQQGKRPDPGTGNKAMWIYLMIALFLFFQYFVFKPIGHLKETNWNTVRNEMLAEHEIEQLLVVNKEKVEITIRRDKLGKGLHSEISNNQAGPHYYFNIGSVESFESRLDDAISKYNLENPPAVSYVTRTNWVQVILSWLFPLFIIVAIWIFIMRRMGRGMGAGGMTNPLDFGKTQVKEMNIEDRSAITFKDVAGLKEAKMEVKEIVEFLQKPEQYTRLGATIPKGVILVGPPGTGKTLLAKAVAGEAKVPFLHMSGSEFVEMFVGVGASRVRDLFKKAKEKAPSIIFIDEIDAIGRARGSAFSLRANDERESTLNQLLTEMDGFGTNTGVIVLAATNRADILDKALLRPGRFDRHIYLELPGMVERKAIFKVHLKPLKLADDIDVHQLAAHTPGFSGADIANICNEAALIAARASKDAVYMSDFHEATDRVIGGLEKKSKIISPDEKKIIAYHESGHATVSWFLEHADELMKVTIVPRGKSLGSAWYLPEEQQIYTKSEFLDKLCVALGGRAAEELVFREVSSGALDDLEKVTKQAYTMVAYYGLNDKIGNLSFYDSTGQYEQSLQKPYSEATAKLIDDEVRKMIEQAYQRTKAILREHRVELEQLAKLLLVKEVVGRAELEGIFGIRSNNGKSILQES
jgi:cell division protease FtsH